MARNYRVFPEVKLDVLFQRSFPEPMSGCWIWMGSTNSVNYGQIKIKTRRWLVTRLTMALIHGEEAIVGMFVCHRCDNPICINPDHLFIGTRSDNVRDMHRKGRAGIHVVRAKWNFQDKLKTHCKNGHEYTPDNILYINSTREHKVRKCKQCKANWKKKQKERLSALRG